ncbi:hypothetical protein SESBI_24321 [Sesbania bispinosa]|nr:hypothetical protein SESBI_24321 [Sesbania bispinosa]
MTWYKSTFKTPEGKCGSSKKVSGNHVTAQQWLKGHAIGKDSCSIDVTSSTFGIRRGGTNGQLAVKLLCDGSNPEDGRVQRVRG